MQAESQPTCSMLTEEVNSMMITITGYVCINCTVGRYTGVVQFSDFFLPLCQIVILILSEVLKSLEGKQTQSVRNMHGYVQVR